MTIAAHCGHQDAMSCAKGRLPNMAKRLPCRFRCVRNPAARTWSGQQICIRQRRGGFQTTTATGARENRGTIMSKTEQEYDDIPGTFVFDASKARKGYGINDFCMSLMKAENREAFKANEAEYLKKFELSPEQTEAILKRQWNRMLELGGNIYFTAKLGATDGLSFQQVAAIMTGSTQEDYAEMMLKGGRSVEGNRSKKEWAQKNG